MSRPANKEENPQSNYSTSSVLKNATNIKEILMVALGSHGSRPLLFVRTNTDLYIYMVSLNYKQIITIK